MNNVKKRNLGLFFSYGYFVLNTILSIFISAFIVRIVGKTDYGVYQSMTAFLSYLVLLEFGTGTLMTRNLSLLKRDGSDKEEVNKNVSTIWSLTVVLSIVICLVAFVFWLFIGKIYSNSLSSDQIDLGKKLFIFAAGNTLLSFLTSTLYGIALAYEKYLLEKIISISKLILRTVLVIILLLRTSSVFLLVVIDFCLSLCAFAIVLTFCLFKLKSKLVFRYFDKGVFKSCIPLAFAMLLQTIVNTANGSIDKFCIGVMLTPEDVSIYSVSMIIFTMFSSISTLPVTMFMPTIANNYKSGMRGKELTKSLIEPCRVNVLIMGVIMFGFLVVGKQFLALVYGEEYIESWIYAVIVIVPMFFNMTNVVIQCVIDLMDKRHIRSLIMMGTTIINILFTIFGIKLFGMIAAPIATAIGLVGQTIILNIFYSKNLEMPQLYLFLESYKGIFLSFIIGAIIAFGLTFIVDGYLLQFLVGGFSFILISVASILIFGLNKIEKIKIKLLISKILHR